MAIAIANPIAREMICFLTKLTSGALLLMPTQPNAVNAIGAKNRIQSTSFSFLWLISTMHPHLEDLISSHCHCVTGLRLRSAMPFDSGTLMGAAAVEPA